jgi:phospholipid/cholesterol/gamma-HCH transport system substrate-binding protein
MAAIKTNFAVGVFMIAGIVIATVVVIFVGASTYLRPGRLYSTFYNESIQGLSKDSPVKYRGVSIGQVHDIRIAKGTQLVEVLLRIETEWEPDATIVAQLKSIGITGIMYVEMDVRQPDEKVLYPAPDYKTEYPVIPTKSSDIEQLLTGIEELVQQVKGTDLHGVSLGMKDTIGTINQTIQDAQVKKLSDGLETAILQANQLLADPKLRQLLITAENTGAHLNSFSEKADSVTSRIETLIAANETDVSAAIHELRDTMEQAGLLIKSGTRTMNQAEESIARIEENLVRTINHLESVSESLKTLTDRSASQPSLLFFAAPMPDKEIEPYD